MAIIPHDAPGVEQMRLLPVLEALNDPVRLSIVTQLAQAGSTLSCGAFGCDVSASTLTHHFTVLRRAGVVSQEPLGTSRMNALREDDLNTAFPGLLDSITRAAIREDPRTQEEEK